MNKLQKAELNILIYFHKFCQEHDLRYSLYAGTLLGSIRHKGFIPWDDDVDVMMERNEFEKFESIFVKSSYREDELIYQSRILDRLLAAPYSKIRSKEINIREMTSLTQKNNYGPWIDIFPMDNVPDDEGLRKDQFRKIYFYNKWIKLFLLTNVKPEDKGIKKILKGFLQKSNEKLAKYNFMLPYLFRKRYKYMTMYNNEKTSYIADMSYMHHRNYEEYSKSIYNKDIFNNLILSEFENKDFYITRDYDYVLKRTYGDYLVLPPLEDRKQHQLEYTEN